MAAAHDRIIADAAKGVLRPLGFQQKGRSRLWFADHNWWLLVVEFQPSSWSKGSYLNVAAHWLWSDVGTVSLDYGGRQEGFEEYVSDEQFADAAARLASAAAREAERLAALFVSPVATAQVLVAEARTGTGRSPGHPGWMAYHAGVAAGLAGRVTDAREMFDHVLEGPAEAGSVLRRAAERMSGLAVNSADFGRETLSVIALQRDRLGLLPLDRARLFSDERVSGRAGLGDIRHA